MSRVASPISSSARRARTFYAAVARHAKELGVKPRRIALRDTVSRWGSCSSTGGLNFSWRLILAPPFVLDYLAAHEVAHIVHMNHSPQFWKLARRLHPGTDRAEVWLKAHGASLHRFGATWEGSLSVTSSFQRREQELQILRTRQAVIAVLDERQRRRVAAEALHQRQRM